MHVYEFALWLERVLRPENIQTKYAQRSGTDQAGYPISLVRNGAVRPADRSNEHGIATVGPGTRRPGPLTVRAVSVAVAVAALAGPVPRLPPLLERIGARREGTRALTEPVQHEAAEAQRNRGADRPEAPGPASRSVRLRRIA